MKYIHDIAPDNLPLASVKEVRKLRNKLPATFFEIDQLVFVKKLAICAVIISLSYVLLRLHINYLVSTTCITVLGFMYAHMVELQHECLHESAFKNRNLNRWVGFVLGIFMMSSYSHYKYDHLRHHAYLGTEMNKEFFNYRFKGINSLPGFIYGAFHLGRYKDVVRNIFYSLTNRDIPNVESKKWQTMIKNEYRFLVAALLLTLCYTLYSGDLFFVYAWYVPALLISEAVHFLIELPEHYGLNTISNPNVLENTRTIYTNAFFEWFTNYNNLHTAHHYHHRIPLCNIRKLHDERKADFSVIEQSYWNFYKKVITNKINYKVDENCMTR